MTEHATEAPKQTDIAQSQKHPPEYQPDLNPHQMEGQNVAGVGPHPEKDNIPTGADIKEFHTLFPEFTNDELRQIVVMPVGSRLEQGATYVNLRDESREEIKATSDMVAQEHNWFVPKSEMDYQMWNRLLGVRNPERTGQADDNS